MKKWIYLLVIIVITGGIIGYLKYNQPHKEASGSAADFMITPSALLLAYETDEAAADLKYLDKIIEINGIVKTINNLDTGASLSIETGNELASIICEFETKEDISNIEIGATVKIKGICTGKLIDVVLVRCSL